MMKAALFAGSLLLAVAAAAEAQVARSPERKKPPAQPTYSPMPQFPGRVPTIGRLPLFSGVSSLGTSCAEWTDAASMLQHGVARGWNVYGAGGRHSFIGVDSRMRVRYLMDSMQDQIGPVRDREAATIHFHPDGSVEQGLRAAWNIGVDAATAPPLTSALFPADTARALAYARWLVRLCTQTAR